VVRLPRRIEGTFRVFVVTDDEDKLYEKAAGEANNVPLVPTPITIHNRPADLQVAEVESDGVVKAGGSITVTWTAANDGFMETEERFWQDGVYLSRDDVLEPAGDIELGFVPHEGVLFPDESYEATGTFVLRQDLEGPYTVYVYTDARHQVYEYLDEDNNIAAAGTPVQVSGLRVDLVADSLTVPATAVAGSAVDLQWRVTNTGADDTPVAAWADYLYLSTDTVLGAGDTLLSSSPHTGVLASGAFYDGAGAVTLPLELGAGTYFLIVDVDGSTANDVFEYEAEDNNTAVGTVEVTLPPVPDLQVVSIAAPATVWSGQVLRVGWRVENPGAAEAVAERGGWYDSVYLSRDLYLDPQYDLNIGSLQHADPLPGSGRDGYDAQLEARIGERLSGDFYVFVATDSTDRVFERDGEANNQLRSDSVVTVQLTPPADLVVTGIIPPSQAVYGEPADWSFGVANQGRLPARGEWFDTLYLSEDEAWDFEDIRVARVHHTGDLGVGTGNTYTATAAGALVPAVLPGSYNVICRTDIFDDVRETDDDNNTRVSAQQLEVLGRPIVPDSPATSVSVDPGASEFYEVSVESGSDLSILLEGTSDRAVEMYAAYGRLPTRSSHGYRAQRLTSDTMAIAVPQTLQGTYYILVYGVENTRGVYDLSASLLTAGIKGLSISEAGNVGEVTVKISGAGFSPGTRVTLAGREGRVYYETSAAIYATVDLAGVDPGLYSLTVINPNGWSGNRDFTVNAGLGGALAFSLTKPELVRPMRPYPMQLVYGNEGDTDVPAPIFDLQIGKDGDVRVCESCAFRSAVQLLGIAGEGPAGVLPPGSSFTLDLEFRVFGNVYVPFYLNAYETSSTEPLDWVGIEGAVRGL
jgi:hypothetical protein